MSDKTDDNEGLTQSVHKENIAFFNFYSHIFFQQFSFSKSIFNAESEKSCDMKKKRQTEEKRADGLCCKRKIKKIKYPFIFFLIQISFSRWRGTTASLNYACFGYTTKSSLTKYHFKRLYNDNPTHHSHWSNKSLKGSRLKDKRTMNE
jgi:hypothetical protein